VYHFVQLSYTAQHRTAVIISPSILQPIITAQPMPIVLEARVELTDVSEQSSVVVCQKSCKLVNHSNCLWHSENVDSQTYWPHFFGPLCKEYNKTSWK